MSLMGSCTLQETTCKLKLPDGTDAGEIVPVWIPPQRDHVLLLHCPTPGLRNNFGHTSRAPHRARFFGGEFFFFVENAHPNCWRLGVTAVGHPLPPSVFLEVLSNCVPQ